MRSKCEVIFKESDFKLATIRSAKTQYEISTLSLIRIRDFMLNGLFFFLLVHGFEVHRR